MFHDTAGFRTNRMHGSNPSLLILCFFLFHKIYDEETEISLPRQTAWSQGHSSFCLDQKVQRNKRMKKSPKLTNNKQMKKQEPIFFESNNGWEGKKPCLGKSLYRISEERGCQSRLPSQTVSRWGWRQGLGLTSPFQCADGITVLLVHSRIPLKMFFCCWC